MIDEIPPLRQCLLSLLASDKGKGQPVISMIDEIPPLRQRLLRGEETASQVPER